MLEQPNGLIAADLDAGFGKTVRIMAGAGATAENKEESKNWNRHWVE